MLNNLKIGTKIGGGFVILLLLTAGLAVVAWNGLSGVTDRVDTADDMNRLVKYILDARIREKNYILEKDDVYVEQMRKLLNELRSQTELTRDEKLVDPLNKAQMDQVLLKVDAYEQAFLQYVEQEKLKERSMDLMHARAGDALAEVEAIRDDQQTQLAHTRTEATQERALYAALMDDANRVTEASLIALNSEKSLVLDGAQRHLRGMNSRLKEIRQLSGSLQEALHTPVLKKAAEKIGTVVDEYLAAFTAWRESGLDQDRKLLERAGRKLIGAARPVKNALADLEFETSRRLEAFIDDKLAQADDANLLVKWFIEGRTAEKELIISGDPKYRLAVAEQLARIKALAESMEARFQEQKNIDQIAHFSQALVEYETNFLRFVDLMAQQTQAEAHMLAAARSAQEVCQEARLDQQLKMETQIGDANALMAAAVSVAMAFGLLVAFVITRGITRPLVRANEIARGIAGGDLEQDVDISGRDEIGQLGASMKVMIQNLRKDIEETRSRAAEASRIRMALDVCSTNVVVSDPQQRIIYHNHASSDTLERIQEALRQDLAELDAGQFLGSRLDAFHPDPEARRADLEGLSEMRRDDLVLGGRHLRLITTPVFGQEGERLGSAMEWTDRTAEVTQALEEKARAEEAARIANENLRIRVALDNVSSSVMMADKERNIIYMNKRVQALFRDAEQDLRKEVPGFDVDRLMGACIDLFHRDPARQARMLESLTRPHTSDLHLGGHTLRIIANPVFNEAGERLGTAVEWTDRTDEVAVEDEVESIVAAAHSGNLEQRVDLTGKTDFFKQLGLSINGLLDLVGRVFDELAQVMSAMAAGDLTQPIRGRYRGKFGQVKHDVNNTLMNLEKTVRDLRGAAEMIHTASDEISAGNGNLSRRTEENAANLEKTASSMEQLTAAVSNNAENARQANQLSTDARQLAQKGGDVVSRAVSAMAEINDASNRIAEIIGVIDEIAFQTNLLALNASVEAARAGEQGRGFAVVAAEVRNLASRSAAAAKEIKELIHDSVSKVQVGTELVNHSGETLEEIVAGVTKVGDIIAEIVAASAEQSDGIEQVNRAVTEMDEGSQQNAALAEETSAAAIALTEKASEMDRMMGFFKVRQNAEQDWGLEEDEPDEFSFMDAKAAHIAWRQRLRDFLDGTGTLTEEEAVSHRDCRLGKWLYEEKALDRFRGIAEMAEMEVEHEAIHRLIREIVDCRQSNDDAGAEQRFKEIGPLSNKIVHLLKMIENRITDAGEAV